MLCDRVLRNLREGAAPAKQIIRLPLTWQQCRMRALKQVLDDGTNVRIILPPGIVLNDGDVIYEDESKLIAVEAVPARLLTATAPDAATLAKIAYGLGNLHLPVEVFGLQIATIPDGPALAVFRQAGVEPTELTRPFHPLPLPNGIAFALSPGFAVTSGPRRGES